MAGMVMANTPGTGEFVYPELRHAKWHGWTLADTIFPSFVWIVGVAITLSLGRRLAKGDLPSALLPGILRRAAIIFLLGVAVYAFPAFDPHTFRILGVLQRIAICYLVAAVLFLYTGWKGQLAAALAALFGYWALMSFAPVPGYGAGRLDVEGNFAHYVDRLLLGSHNYGNTKTWDPEGIVSTLPAIASALFGVFAGQILAHYQTMAERIKYLLLTGAVLVPLALLWNQWLPINKSIWTSSFATFMAGLDFLLLGAIVWLVDSQGVKAPFRPFVIMGSNAIAIYMASEIIDIALHNIALGNGLTARAWLYQTFFAPLASPVNASLLYSIAYTLLMLAIAWVLYRKQWFLRV